uniref:Transmembrane protein 41A-B-like n=1 Tax=Sinocyclocheilus anshuiensis TaxID=1608454 RepID=A0A671T1V4_9TELE
MRSIWGLIALVAAATFYLYLLSAFLPPGPVTLYCVSSSSGSPGVGNVQIIGFPSDLDELRELAELLQFYKTEHTGYVSILFCSAYLYKQSFAIPGSSFLNMLAGALFGPWHGLLIACTLTTVGSTNCYLLSRTFGKRHIVRLFPEKVAMLQRMNYFNDFFFQLMNNSEFICVRTGAILSEIHSLDDIFSWGTLLQLLLIACVSLLPGALIRRCSQAHLKLDDRQKRRLQSVNMGLIIGLESQLRICL